MNKVNVRHEVLHLLGRLHKEYPNKSPYIFGPGFEKSDFKIFDADKEIVIPDTLCINSHVLDLLSDSKTVFHIDKYMETSGRSITVGPNINRVASILIMMSSLEYSFHIDTFPYCTNSIVSQMWKDMEQMAKADHVCCTIVSMAMRGRSCSGFQRRHAPRHQMEPVSVLDIPKFERPVSQQHIMPRFKAPPPPPPRTSPPDAKDLPKSFADVLDDKK